MVKLKKLNEQVMVITGATSGIGLTTARMAAERGARLVVAARGDEALRQLVDEISRLGGQAVSVVADVSNQDDVRRIADTAINTYGGFDTWVNDAGISIYGELTDVPIEEQRQLFDTNYWGIVHGSLAAVDHLRLHGGALINLGSVLSDRAIPLQGAYCASKHAVKGFTDTLRMELEHAGAPVSVTLIKPGPIDTPYTLHSRNHMDAHPKHVPPVYKPEVVAEAILRAAETPIRDVYAGGAGLPFGILGMLAPRLTDLLMNRVWFSQSKSDRPPLPQNRTSLNAPSGQLEERGDYPGMVLPNSLYTRAALHPVRTTAAIAGTGLAVAAVVRAARAFSKN